jgi:cysteinyl-tRNA synthetase
MAFRVYNTLGRKKMDFIPLKEGEVGIYSCGPTVYNYLHIGNLRAFAFADLLRRYLKFKGYKVKQVMNITDVDDKTIRDSKKEGRTLNEFTKFYTDIFLKDLQALNMETPEFMPKATEHIQEMVEIIKKMKEKGHTYEKGGSIYAKISTIKNYGKLACLDFDNLKQNADGRLNNSDEYEKEDARDFVLWKGYNEDDGDVYWETELGKGRPGWHIECSAMSMKYLGESFDIHTGGVDLVFPHHTNEIAQSESATGKPFVKYWVHNDHLIVNGEKMSKSLGNFFTLNDLIEKGYDTRAIRYELIKTHYRMKLDFREDELKKIPETLAKLDETINKLQNAQGEGKIDASKTSKEAMHSFEEAMDDDLNISGGLAAVFEFIKKINQQIADGEIGKDEAEIYLETLKKIDCVLGVMKFEKSEVPVDILELAEKRALARKNKDWAKSDELREQIRTKGYGVVDDKEGYRIKKIDSAN